LFFLLEKLLDVFEGPRGGGVVMAAILDGKNIKYCE
jgi:hypothetical protein